MKEEYFKLVKNGYEFMNRKKIYHWWFGKGYKDRIEKKYQNNFKTNWTKF